MDHDSFIFYEKAIEGKSPKMQVAYLMGCLANLSVVFRQSETEVDKRMGPMPVVTRRIWLCLVQSRGQVKSLEELTRFVYFALDDDEMPDPTSMVKAVQRAREWTNRDFGVIKTEWGRGYRFERSVAP